MSPPALRVCGAFTAAFLGFWAAMALGLWLWGL